MLEGTSGHSDNLFEGRRIIIIKIQPKKTPNPYNLKIAVMAAQEVIEHAVCESFNAINPRPLAMSLNVLLSRFNPPDCWENLEA